MQEGRENKKREQKKERGVRNARREKRTRRTSRKRRGERKSHPRISVRVQPCLAPPSCDSALRTVSADKKPEAGSAGRLRAFAEARERVRSVL